MLNKSLLYVKIESSYGVDPVPTKELNAILAGPVTVEPTFRKLERLNVKQFLGNRPAVNVGELVKVSFETELRGHGTDASLPPQHGVLYRGCGMAETIDISSGAQSLTFTASTKKVARAAGSFVTDGFFVGQRVTTNAALNPGPFTVSAVAALELTFSAGDTIVDEGPVTKTVTGKQVKYTPQDALDGPSVTLYGFRGDASGSHLYKVTGCRGKWSKESKAGDYSKLKWEMQGLYDEPEDIAMPLDAVLNEALVPPQFVSAVFSLGSFAGVIENLKLDYGNELEKRPDANAATGFLAHYVKERKVTAQIDPEAPALSVFNPITAIKNGTEYTLAAQVGTAYANRAKFSCPRVILDSAKYAERGNIMTWDGSLLVCPTSAGQDEVKIIFY